MLNHLVQLIDAVHGHPSDAPLLSEAQAGIRLDGVCKDDPRGVHAHAQDGLHLSQGGAVEPKAWNQNILLSQNIKNMKKET